MTKTFFSKMRAAQQEEFFHGYNQKTERIVFFQQVGVRFGKQVSEIPKKSDKLKFEISI